MKIIINERQLRTIIESEDKAKKNLRAYKETIDELGVDKALELLGLKMYQFFNAGVIDFNDYTPFDLFPVLFDMQKEYKGCDIEVDWYDDTDYGVYWVYKEQIGNYEINCVTMAFPEFAIGKTYVENAHCWVDNNLEISDFNNKINYDVKTIDFDIPTEFESWDVMVEWYKTEYMPNTYEIIERQAFEIIKQLKKKNEI
jgi:hypothetical protein